MRSSGSSSQVSQSPVSSPIRYARPARTQERNIHPVLSNSDSWHCRVLVAAGGIGLARRLYVTDQSASERAARRFAGLHRLLSHKSYVDELYNATVVAFTSVAARGLWMFDRRVVDGFVNGSGWVTLFGSWMSGLTNRAVVDGIVNGLGTRIQRASYSMRQLQTGLVQNYALLMLFGVFAFASLYLFVR